MAKQVLSIVSSCIYQSCCSRTGWHLGVCCDM